MEGSINKTQEYVIATILIIACAALGLIMLL
jgi:hypothetical protein